MIIKYEVNINDKDFSTYISKLTNRIYKLLPGREEGLDWQSPLDSLVLEVAGMAELLHDHTDLFPLLCKMESMRTLTEEEDFLEFRKTIFECLHLLERIKALCLD